MSNFLIEEGEILMYSQRSISECFNKSRLNERAINAYKASGCSSAVINYRSGIACDAIGT